MTYKKCRTCGNDFSGVCFSKGHQIERYQEPTPTKDVMEWKKNIDQVHKPGEKLK